MSGCMCGADLGTFLHACTPVRVTFIWPDMLQLFLRVKIVTAFLERKGSLCIEQRLDAHFYVLHTLTRIRKFQINLFSSSPLDSWREKKPHQRGFADNQNSEAFHVDPQTRHPQNYYTLISPLKSRKTDEK